MDPSTPEVLIYRLYTLHNPTNPTEGPYLGSRQGVGSQNRGPQLGPLNGS